LDSEESVVNVVEEVMKPNETDAKEANINFARDNNDGLSQHVSDFTSYVPNTCESSNRNNESYNSSYNPDADSQADRPNVNNSVDNAAEKIGSHLEANYQLIDTSIPFPGPQDNLNQPVKEESTVLSNNENVENTQSDDIPKVDAVILRYYRLQ
jgi:hypothetical protein